jgi:hypothetical protein
MLIGPLIHDPVGSAGGIAARWVGNSGTGASPTLRYRVVSPGAAGATTRAYAVTTAVDGGAQLSWIRGTNPFETRPDPDHLALKPRPRDARYPDASKLCAQALGDLGYTIEVQGEAPGSALMLFSRHDNAWIVSGYAETPIGTVALRFPKGAPLFHATFARLSDGASIYPLSRSMRHECRLFVQQESGVVGCDTRARDEHHHELTLRVTGLQEATVTFLPPRGRAVTFEHSGGARRFEMGVSCVTQSGLSGELLIRW